MKRIILTESQYKKLVSQPLNEQNNGGGKIIFSKGYVEDDIISDRVWNFLNILKEKLWEKYGKNLFISELREKAYEFDYNYVVVEINNGKYSNEEKRYIKKIIKKGKEYDGEFISYGKKTNSIYFSVPFSELKINQIDNPEEIEDVLDIEYPEEIEDVTIEDPEEIKDDSEESDGICESGDCENDRGVYRYNNGDVYDGIFVNGKLDVGTYTYENGDKYDGTFVDDTFNGDGIFFDKETNIQYEGTWEDGELINNVSIHYPNGAEYEGDIGSIDEGLKPDGYGKMFYYDNSTGTLDGYVGEWVDGKKDGQGTYTYDDGRILDGIWEDDNIKDGTIKYPDGKEYNIEDGVVVEDEEIEIPDDEEIEIISECECCTEENTKFYQDNVTNLKKTNDFRWWVHQDEDRLKKVNDKLEECGYDDGLNTSNSNYNSESEYMIISFGEVGQEWIDDGKPEKPVGVGSVDIHRRAQFDIKRNRVSQKLIDDITTAAEISGVGLQLSWARKDHKVGGTRNNDSTYISRHCYGAGIDISMFKNDKGDLVNWNSESDAKAKGIYDKIISFNNQLESMGYNKNSEGKHSKAFLTFGFRKHDNHIHVSNTNVNTEFEDTYKELKAWCNTKSVNYRIKGDEAL